MAATEQIPLTTADALARWKWLYAGFGALFAAVVIVVVVDSGSWGVLGLAPVLLVAIQGVVRARRFEKILRDPKLATQIEKYRGLKKGNFEDACRKIEEDGFLIRFDKVILASPSTWGRKQGRGYFDCDPFEVTVDEKNGRVGSVSVFVKDDMAR